MKRLFVMFFVGLCIFSLGVSPLYAQVWGVPLDPITVAPPPPAVYLGPEYVVSPPVATYYPPAFVSPWSTVVAPLPATYVIGPPYYIPGQPIRNALRALFP